MRQPDALDQIGQRQVESRQDGADHVAGCVPADMTAFQHRDAGPLPGRAQRRGQTGQARPDHADIDVEVEIQPDAADRACGIRVIVRACESLAHGVFLANPAPDVMTLLVAIKRRGTA